MSTTGKGGAGIYLNLEAFKTLYLSTPAPVYTVQTGQCFLKCFFLASVTLPKFINISNTENQRLSHSRNNCGSYDTKHSSR